MKRVAVISAILEQPNLCQHEFNQVISSFQGIVKGRMGIPMPEENMAVISLVVVSSTDEINSLTGRLGRLEHVTVKTSISKKEVD